MSDDRAPSPWKLVIERLAAERKDVARCLVRFLRLNERLLLSPMSPETMELQQESGTLMVLLATAAVKAIGERDRFAEAYAWMRDNGDELEYRTWEPFEGADPGRQGVAPLIDAPHLISGAWWLVVVAVGAAVLVSTWTRWRHAPAAIVAVTLAGATFFIIGNAAALRNRVHFERFLSTLRAEGEGQGRAGARGRVGYVFLSWTARSAREYAAMLGIKQALDHFGIEHFDYTRSTFEGENDASEQIEGSISQAIARATCSVELASVAFGASEWIEYERDLLRKAAPSFARILVCMEDGYEFVASPDEHRVLRLNVSDGQRTFGHVEDFMQPSRADAGYFQTAHYLAKCFCLAQYLRRSLELGHFNLLAELRPLFARNPRPR